MVEFAGADPAELICRYSPAIWGEPCPPPRPLTRIEYGRAATPGEAYEKTRQRYRLDWKGSGYRILQWSPGLGVWIAYPHTKSRREAEKERAGLVTAHALLLLGLEQDKAAKLLAKHSTGSARDRIARAYRTALEEA
jgi:hypothetical protein